MTSQGVKNKKVRHETKSSDVTVVLHTLWRFLWSITVHTGECYLFVLYNKNSNGLLKDLWGMKKEKQVCWRDLTWIWRHLCVCSLIDHGQQPMKMHTEVTLLLVFFNLVLLPHKNRAVNSNPFHDNRYMWDFISGGNINQTLFLT